MKIINIFNENGETLQQIIEKGVINYCLKVGTFKQ